MIWKRQHFWTTIKSVLKVIYLPLPMVKWFQGQNNALHELSLLFSQCMKKNVYLHWYPWLLMKLSQQTLAQTVPVAVPVAVTPVSIGTGWDLLVGSYLERHNELPYEPPHDKTNKMTCAPSADSDQPGHPPSLIRVFAVRMKKAWPLSYPLSA